MDELGQLFESLDSISDFLGPSMEGWQTPSFIGLGSESTGKSTLLERVSMLSMFPRDDGNRPSRGTRHGRMRPGLKLLVFLGDHFAENRRRAPDRDGPDFHGGHFKDTVQKVDQLKAAISHSFKQFTLIFW